MMIYMHAKRSTTNKEVICSLKKDEHSNSIYKEDERRESRKKEARNGIKTHLFIFYKKKTKPCISI